jgi:hypothetical protein
MIDSINQEPDLVVAALKRGQSGADVCEQPESEIAGVGSRERQEYGNGAFRHLRLLSAGDLAIELSWSSSTEKWTKVAKTSGAKPD